MLKDLKDSDRLYTIDDLEAMLDQIPYEIWLKDKYGRYIYINKLSADLIGLPKEEILGKCNYDIIDYNTAQKCAETDKKLMDSENNLYFLEVKNLNGQNRFHNVHKFKINKSTNQEIIMGGISNEVSIEKNLRLEMENNLLNYLDKNENDYDSKNNLQSLLGNLNTTLKSKNIDIFLYNEDEKLFNLYMSENKENPTFKEDAKIIIDEEIESKLYSNELLTDRYCEIHKKILKLQNNNEKNNYKLKHIKLADKLFSLVCISYSEDIDTVLIEDLYLDKVFGKISIIIKQIENQGQISSIKKKKDELEEVIKLESILTDFFANISHEFRTPVNIILSIVQLLTLFIEDKNKKIDIGKEKYKEYLHILKQNSYRLLRLVSNIIDTAKISNNFYDLKLENHNIVNIVENITLSTVKYANDKNRNIIFDTDEEEVMLACDPDKIERIILNLISNAIKFSKENTDIQVNMNTDLDKNMVFISVKNYGEVISEEDKKRIFGKFNQVDSLFIRENEGSGIGLFLTKKFVEMHQGEIYLDDIEDGTQFTFYLPIYTLDKEYKKEEECNTDNIVEKCNIEFSDIYS